LLIRRLALVATSRAKFANDVPRTMTDLSRNVSSAMADFSSHVAGRVANRSTGFLNLSAARPKSTAKNKRKHKFNGRTEHLIQPSPHFQRGHQAPSD
jgi:hypothetical protein